jgi:hypothetical protein
VDQPPVNIPVVKPDANRANPKLGVGMLAFSCDCRYMYTRNGDEIHRFLKTNFAIVISRKIIL